MEGNRASRPPVSRQRSHLGLGLPKGLPAARVVAAARFRSDAVANQLQ
jgi:hypothetical protein